MTDSKRVAALIVGGGAAGATTALCLARRGLPALVVESSTYDGFRVGETLPPVGRVLLERLGLWEHFATQEHVPSQAIHSAWGSAELAEQHSLYSLFGTGWHLERRRFDEMLAAAAAAAGAQVLRASRITTLSLTEKVHARIECPAGELAVEAEVVVDATGRASSVARAFGSVRVAYDRLVGILGIFEPPPEHRPPTPALLLESVLDGWWYSVPLPCGALLVAAMVDADAIPASGLRPIGYFQSLLAKSHHTRARTLGLNAPESVVVRKASTERLSRIVGPALIAVGDAATSYDPLSSQGICKALMSAELAAQAIAERLGGAEEALLHYEHQVLTEFSRFLGDRGRHYAMERRWPESLFWRRRLPSDPRDRALSLDPRALLRQGELELAASLVADLEGTLPLGEVERLHGLCKTPRAAHEILSQFQNTAKVQATARDALTALQGLVRQGALVKATHDQDGIEAAR